MRPWLWLRIGFVVLTTCGPGTGRVPVQWLDRTVFERDVEPVLTTRCAGTLCHARPERALALYAPLRFREDPARVAIDEPLTPSEIEHNYVTSCVVEAATDPGEGPWLLRKAMGAGVFHGGGVVFDDASDPDYVRLADWIAGAR